jgi:hypothetical protein
MSCLDLLQEKLEAEIGSRESSIKQALAAAEEDKVCMVPARRIYE